MALQINKKISVGITILLSIVALYALVGFLVLPWYATKALPDYVAEELQRELLIEKIQFNPFTLTIAVRSIALNEKNQTAIASLSELFVDVDLNLNQLLDKTINIPTIRLNEPHIELIKDKTGSLNFDRLIKSFPNDENSNAEASSLNFIFESTHIMQGSVLVVDNSQELPIESLVKDINLSFSSISTIQEDEGDYQVSLDLDKHTKININGTLTLFPLMSVGKFQVNGLSAESVNGWVSELSTVEFLDFNAALQGDYQVLSNDKGEVSFNVDKTDIKIQDISITETERLVSASLKKLELNNLSYANDRLSVDADQLSLSDINVQAEEQILLNVKNLSFSTIAYNIEAATLSLAAVNLNSIHLLAKEQTLLDVAKLSVSDINYDVDAAALNLATLALNDLDLLLKQDLAPLYHLGEFKLNKLSYDNKIKLLDIDKLELITNNIALDTDSTGKFIPPEINIETNSAVEHEPTQQEASTDLKLNLAELHITNTSLGLINTANISAQETVLTLNELKLTGSEFDFSQHKLNMGSLDLLDAKLGLIIDNEGVLNVQQLFSSDEPTEVITEIEEQSTSQFNLGKLNAKGVDIQISDNSNALELQHKLSNIGLEMLNLSNVEKSRSELKMNVEINEQGQLNLTGWVEPGTAKVNLNIVLSNLALAHFSPYIEHDSNLSVKSGELTFKANISNSDSESGLLIDQAEAELDNFLLNDLRSDSRLIAFNKLSVADFGVTTSPLDIRVDKIKLSEPYINVHIDEQQNLNLVSAFGNKENISDNTDSEDVNANATTSISLKSIELEQGNMDFSDLSMTPKFSVAIDELHGLATGVNSAQDRYTSLNLNGRVNEFGSIAITGELQPFDFRKQSEVNMQFRNISTNSLSPYAAKFAGRHIKSGSLSLTLDYKLSNNKLNGSNNIILESLVLGEKVSSPDAMDLPLDMAISLLQDGDGKIDIKIPIKGDLDNPEFEIKSIVQKAIGNLIGGIVTAPFTFIGSLFDIDGEELKFINFEPGQSEIMPPEAEKLTALGKALLERPALILIVSGVYDAKHDSMGIAKKAVLDDISKVTENETSTLNYSEPKTREAIDELAAQRVDKVILSKLQEKAVVDSEADEPSALTAFYKNQFSQLVTKASSTIDKSLLELLARDRVNAITEYIKNIDISLAERIKFTGEFNVVASETELVSVTLEIDAVK